MPTQAQRSETTIAELLDAAEALFVERGYADTSIEDIVVAAGVTRGALYHHFDSKAAVFRAVFERQQQMLTRRLVSASRKERDSWSQLRAGCRAFLQLCLEPAVRQICLLDGPAALGWHEVRQIESQHTLALLRHGLSMANTEGLMVPGDLDTRLHLVYAALCEAAELIARAEKPRVALRAVTAELDHLLDGFAAHR